MALKSTSSNTSKKAKATSGDEPPVVDKTKTKKLKKVPSQFIIRPSSALKYKGASKVYIHEDILLQLEDINENSLVYLTKEGEINGLVAIIASSTECEQNVIQVSRSLRKLGAFLLGERLIINKWNGQPRTCNSMVVGTSDGLLLSDVSLKNVEKFYDEVGLIYPGLTLIDSSVKLDKDSDLKSNLDLTVIDIDEPVEDGLQKLSLKEEEEGVNNQPLYSPPFIFKKNFTKIEFTSSTIVSKDKYPYLPNPINYSSLGGLKEEIKSIKNSIELPLYRSELFTQFGISPPRGVLLHGPPGTGKTLILKAVANETDAHVLTINGPSIVSKYLGETESCIRDIFIEARKYQPSIIFIDEIDSLAPNRNGEDSGEVESRVVATLLTMMDGIGDAGKLVIVAATNRPNSIDLLLRRPGRFDKEIEIGIPDVDARLDILQIQFAKTSKHLLTNDDIADIASKTHGYVGADLIALCRESVLKTIQRCIDLGVDDQMVTKEDVEMGLNEIRPSAMREIFLEMPKVYWSDIGGQEIVKQKLREMVQLPLEAADTFKNLGIKAPKGLLLYGPPGCSKTLTAKALATESGLNFLAVKGPEIFNKYVGESEKSIREIFRKARSAAPSIIFFDEIDAISQDRSDGDSSHTSNQVLTTLLNEIDGVEELNGVVIVAATNRPDSIDAALLRPGRLDRHIYVSPPDFEARLQILKKGSCNFKLQDDDVDLTKFAELTEGHSGAEVALLAQEAGLALIMEDNMTNCVKKRHFEIGLKGLSKGITVEMLEYYQDFAERNGSSL